MKATSFDYEKVLAGGDLRSIGNANSVVKAVTTQLQFDRLFDCVFHNDRKIAMRAADAVEKITVRHPGFIAPHKEDIFKLLRTATDKEIKWHVALLLARLKLDGEELKEAVDVLTHWAKNEQESKIVRVNAIQAIYELSLTNEVITQKFLGLLTLLERTNAPSLIARIKIIKRNLTG